MIVNSIKQNDKQPKEIQKLIKLDKTDPWIKATFSRLLKNQQK